MILWSVLNHCLYTIAVSWMAGRGHKPDLDMHSRCAYALSDFMNRHKPRFMTLKTMRMIRVVLRSDLNPLFFVNINSFWNAFLRFISNIEIINSNCEQNFTYYKMIEFMLEIGINNCCGFLQSAMLWASEEHPNFERDYLKSLFWRPAEVCAGS